MIMISIKKNAQQHLSHTSPSSWLTDSPDPAKKKRIKRTKLTSHLQRREKGFQSCRCLLQQDFSDERAKKNNEIGGGRLNNN
jgi:hypothetical protein